MNVNILSYLLGIFIIVLSEMRPFNPYALCLAIVPKLLWQRYSTVIILGDIFEYLTYWLICSFLVWGKKRKRGELDKGTKSVICVLAVLLGEMVWMIWGLYLMNQAHTIEHKEWSFRIFRTMINEEIPLQIVACIAINLFVIYMREVFSEVFVDSVN